MTPFTIEPAIPAAEEFLWAMLFHAARMSEDGATALDAAKHNPDLAKYVRGWGRPGDLGFVAWSAPARQPLGAAWARLLIGADRTASYIDDLTPELAIAVLPAYHGQGIGAALLARLVAAAPLHYPALSLNVRADNPAVRLYHRAGFIIVGEIINRVGTRSYTMLLDVRTRKANM